MRVRACVGACVRAYVCVCVCVCMCVCVYSCAYSLFIYIFKKIIIFLRPFLKCRTEEQVIFVAKVKYSEAEIKSKRKEEKESHPRHGLVA